MQVYWNLHSTHKSYYAYMDIESQRRCTVWQMNSKKSELFRLWNGFMKLFVHIVKMIHLNQGHSAQYKFIYKSCVINLIFVHLTKIQSRLKSRIGERQH